MKTHHFISALHRGARAFVPALFLAGSLAAAFLAAPTDGTRLSGEHVRLNAPTGQSTLGDFVWYDTDGNGQENLGEPGIDSVMLWLYLDNDDGVFEPGVDTFVAELMTGDNPGTPGVEMGWYDFQVNQSNAVYWVHVVAANFAPGGPLFEHLQTNAEAVGLIPLFVYLPEGVQDYNEADIGFRSEGGASTVTLTPTTSPTPTASATASSTPSNTPTVTSTPTPSSTPTASTTPTPSLTPTPTATCPPQGCRYPVYLPVIIGEPSPTPTPTPTLSPTPTPTVELTGLAHPKSVVAREDTHDIYVTSRDNNRVYRFDGTTLAEEASGRTGLSPWGVDVNLATGKLYVANFASGDVTVLNAETLAPLATIGTGGHPTQLKVNAAGNKVYVALYGANRLAVIDGGSDTLEASIYAGGAGVWGLAFNPSVGRVYVSTRDSGTITTLSAGAPYSLLESQTRSACGSFGSSPYSMDFDAVTNRLYVACAPAGSVNTAMIYEAGATGLTVLASAPLGNGGPDGGGGVAVDPSSGNVYFTNAAADTVTVIDRNNRVEGSFSTGAHPFGVDVDSTTGRVYVVNREGNTITMR